MQRRDFLATSAKVLAIGAAAPSLLLEGCTTSTTLASLVAVLGSTAAQIAAVEGNSTLAQQIQADAQAAAAAILNWKSGTPAQNIVVILTDIQADLNLLPISTIYEPLIQLALGTTITIIEILDPSAAPTPATVSARASHVAKHPKTATIVAKNGKYSRTVSTLKFHFYQDLRSVYVKSWNAIVSDDSQLTALRCNY